MVSIVNGPFRKRRQNKNRQELLELGKPEVDQLSEQKKIKYNGQHYKTKKDQK